MLFLDFEVSQVKIKCFSGSGSAKIDFFDINHNQAKTQLGKYG